MKEERFEFGKNWKAFLGALDEERIARSVESVKEMLAVQTLKGKDFLDIGCGSGLFSLAAQRLGANVISVDYDVDSVECTKFLKEKFGDDTTSWTVQQGSVLDEAYMRSLGEFDVVYSWGVLHHTGDMENAISIASKRVAKDGLFCIALYNDQGHASKRWLKIKQRYNRLPAFLRPAWVALVAGYYELKFAVARLVRGRNPLPFQDWRQKKAERGMSAWYDWVDWIGGLPFEVATPDEITEQMTKCGFELQRLTTVGKGWGCNEFVFRRSTT